MAASIYRVYELGNVINWACPVCPPFSNYVNTLASVERRLSNARLTPGPEQNRPRGPVLVAVHIPKALNFELNLRRYVGKTSHRKIKTIFSFKLSEQTV